MTKELKVTFAPGCFDSFDGTQEELDELLESIRAMAASGELLEQSYEMTEEDFDELPDDVKDAIMNVDDTPRKLQ
jgi:hypothetical protein